MHPKPLSLFAIAISALGCAVGAEGDASDDTLRVDQALTAAPNMQLRLTGPLVGTVGGSATYNVWVQNFGDAVAASPEATLTLPAGVGIVSLPAGCAPGPAAQQVTCAFASLFRGYGAGRDVVLSLPPSSGTATITGVVRTATPESTTSDNAASVYTWVNLAAPVPLALSFPQVLASWVCVDPVSDIRLCPRTQLRAGYFALDANGTIRLPATQVGTWSQPAGPTSLRIEIRNATTGALQTWFDTTAVSSSCVQGAGQASGQPRVARFCAQP